MSQQRNTLRYFADQIAEFYGLMGDKRAWADDGKTIMLAKKALGCQYLDLKLAPEEMEQAATYLQSALSGMVRRADLLNINLI